MVLIYLYEYIEDCIRKPQLLFWRAKLTLHVQKQRNYILPKEVNR